MKRVGISIVKGVMLSVLMAALFGCASSMQQPNQQQIERATSQLKPAGQLAAKRGYLCTAKNRLVKTNPITAWSSRLVDAKAYALSRCESHSRHSDACEIETCTPTGMTTVASNRWFTCYVPNHQESGVWSATFHQRITAEKAAYSRCVRFSRHPKQCYMSYCRIW